MLNTILEHPFLIVLSGILFGFIAAYMVKKKSR